MTLVTMEDTGLAVEGGRPTALPIGLDELLESLDSIRDRLDRMVGMFEEFLPLLRAYFDPNQGGVRGFALRRAMTKAEGRTREP